MTLTSKPIPPATKSGPAWDVARLFPDQGDWHPEDYLALNRLTNRLAELSDGCIEVLEMPTPSHQTIVFELCRLLKEFITSRRLGRAFIAPLPVRLNETTFREPDVVFVASEHASWITEDFVQGADLVMEVLSGDRNRDLVKKRAEYAQANVPEYWIVDPRDRLITVLALESGRYTVAGEFAPERTATSRLLPGFGVDVSQLFSAS